MRISSNPSVDTYIKSHIWLFSEMMQYANASFSLIDVYNYGTKNTKTGKWSGMMGNLSEGLVDLAVAPFLINSQRSEAVQYITAFFQLNAYFIFRRPSLSQTNNIFLLPFDELVWTCTILLIGLVVVSMTGAVVVEWRRYLKMTNQLVN